MQVPAELIIQHNSMGELPLWEAASQTRKPFSMVFVAAMANQMMETDNFSPSAALLISAYSALGLVTPLGFEGKATRTWKVSRAEAQIFLGASGASDLLELQKAASAMLMTAFLSIGQGRAFSYKILTYLVQELQLPSVTVLRPSSSEQELMAEITARIPQSMIYATMIEPLGLYEEIPSRFHEMNTRCATRKTMMKPPAYGELSCFRSAGVVYFCTSFLPLVAWQSSQQ